VTVLSSPPARYLLQHGKPVRKVVDRLLAGAHRAGFLVLARRNGPLLGGGDADPHFGMRYGTVTSSAAVERRTWRFDLESRDYPKGMVALEVTHLHYPGEQAIQAIELALDLHQGPTLLIDRVLALVELQPGLIPARLHDAERALLTTCQKDRTARTAPGEHLGIESRWQDLGLAHLKSLGAQLQIYEPRAWESLEPEGVHQMRVTTRRLREALRAFGPVLPQPGATLLREELRWLGGVLGSVRDLDVQIGRVERTSDENDFEPNHTVNGYLQHLRKRQRRAHRALVTALAEPRYRALARDLQELVTLALAEEQPEADIPIAKAAPAALERLLKRVRRSGRQALANCDAARLHRLRIDAKRLRYFLEYVATVGGAAVADGIQALNRLQDTLGEHQDACVAHDELRAYRRTADLTRRDRKRLRRLMDAEARKVAAARNAFRNEWPAFAASSRDLVLC